jgi:hypothetical protein
MMPGSSDDEIRSTPECSSGEEQESESLISEKGNLPEKYKFVLNFRAITISPVLEIKI